jgi:uncharacterized OB-fold protein
MPGPPGEKAVVNFDEDSITMAAAAAIDCLNGLDRQALDGLFFASTTSPYKEKQASTTVAAGADLRSDIITGDYTNTLRAGTLALRAALDAVKAGSAKQVMVTAADCRRPPIMGPFPVCLWREKDQVLRLYGVKCKACGRIQYPPQRVCTLCHAKDNFEDVRLSDKKGEIFTYALDYIAGTLDIPLAITVVNLEGGGRLLNTMTDRDINEIKIGMPVEMSFRKLFYAGGIHNYFWKTIPVRA